MSRSTVVVLVAAMLLAGLCCGCNKFTRARYDTIYVGEPAFEVEKTLGRPDAAFSDSWSYINEKPFYKAIIQFKDARVTKKSWYDEREMGDHPDSMKPSDERKPKVEIKTGTVVE